VIWTDHGPQHGAVPMVRTQAGEGSEQDGRHRRAEREMENLGTRKGRLGSEHQGQRRHHHQSAANTEHAGKEAGKQAQRDIRQPPEQVRPPVKAAARRPPIIPRFPPGCALSDRR
jgi:hypothetical protein